MRTRLLLLLIFVFLMNLGAAPPLALSPPVLAPAAPQVFASPINAACFQVTPSVCKLHVDPFTIQIESSKSLAAFQLRANGSLLYDFRTDVSNPPSGNYTPSLVKLDFAAACGTTYTVNLLARDSGDPGFLNAGQAENIACPPATYIISLPVVVRQP